MGVREQLATAANTVDGVSAHPFYVQGTKPGHCYVQLERIEYPTNGFGGVRFWRVFVITPQDQGLAEKYIEAKLPALREALEEHLVITQALPQQLEIPGVGVLLCLSINGHREE